MEDSKYITKCGPSSYGLNVEEFKTDADFAVFANQCDGDFRCGYDRLEVSLAIMVELEAFLENTAAFTGELPEQVKAAEDPRELLKYVNHVGDVVYAMDVINEDGTGVSKRSTHTGAKMSYNVHTRSPMLLYNDLSVLIGDTAYLYALRTACLVQKRRNVYADLQRRFHSSDFLRKVVEALLRYQLSCAMRGDCVPSE